MRRMGVLGSFVLDTIHHPGRGGPVRVLGGITYSLAAFEAAAPEGWRQRPIAKLGRDARDRVEPFLDGLTTLDGTDGVVPVPGPNNRVELRYRPDGTRTERLSGGVPGWSWEELEPLARPCDALYVNLIAGWELDLACARRLRDGFRGPIFCDLHSLLLDRGPDGRRVPRAPEGWRAWVGCFDYVQMNEEELALLAREAGTDPRELAEDVVGRSPRALFVTLGPRGAAWVAYTDGGREQGRAEVPRRIRDGDPTGCGDVWGVACFGGLLEDRPVAEAARRANALAARNAALRGAEALTRVEGAALPGEGDAGTGAAPPGGGGNVT